MLGGDSTASLCKGQGRFGLMNANATEILETLQTLGVRVTPIPPDTLRLEPASRVPPELLPCILESKPAILSALASAAVETAHCRHCEGKGECDCPACTLRRVAERVACLMCRPRQRQLWLAASARRNAGTAAGPVPVPVSGAAVRESAQSARAAERQCHEFVEHRGRLYGRFISPKNRLDS